MSPELGGWGGAKLRALRTQAIVFQAQVYRGAGGRDPVPFHWQGTMEESRVQREQEKGCGWGCDSIATAHTHFPSWVRGKGKLSLDWIRVGLECQSLGSEA